jgi:hypothetical protein
MRTILDSVTVAMFIIGLLFIFSLFDDDFEQQKIAHDELNQAISDAQTEAYKKRMNELMKEGERMTTFDARLE